MIRKRPLEIVLAFLIALLVAFYARSEYIPNWPDQVIAAASEEYNVDFGQPGPWFSAWALGDGQAFAVIAADPTGDLLSVEIKEPVYRFARAGYGWLTALVVLGNDHLIPYGLATVGAAGVLALFGLSVAMRERLGPKAWLIVMNPAVFLGFAGDTTEPIGVLFLAFAMAGSSIWAAIALGVTRPTYALALVGRWKPFLITVGTALALLAYSLLRFGFDEGLSGGRFDLPFVAYVQNSTVAGWILVASAAFTVWIGVKKREIAWVVAGIAVVMLGTDVTRNPANAWRAAGMLPLLWAFGTAFVSTERRKKSAPVTAQM